MTYDAELRAAEIAARAAGELLRARPAQVRHKRAADLVTELDLASEARIRELLAPTGIPVQGEEGGGVDRGSRWVVDPLDGTTNFVHGYPAWCVSIGLMDGTEPVVGVLYDPIHDHLYRAARGQGARRNEELLRVSEVACLDDALAVTGFPPWRREISADLLPFVERALRSTQGLRRSGSAATDLCHVAAGQVDLYWEFGLNPWDTCAGAVLLREAGGRISRLDGGPWVPEDKELLVSNARIHDAAVELFAGLRRPGT